MQNRLVCPCSNTFSTQAKLSVYSNLFWLDAALQTTLMIVMHIQLIYSLSFLRHRLNLAFSNFCVKAKICKTLSSCDNSAAGRQCH